MSRNRWLDDDDDFQVNKVGSNEYDDFEPGKDYHVQVMERKQRNMKESTERSLRILAESEEVGVDTAKELVRQGEVLRSTEKRVDKMEQDLKESDRHLRSIKSLWGAFRNKFSKEPPPPSHLNIETSNNSNGGTQSLQEAVEKSDAMTVGSSYSEHPVLNRQQQNRDLYSGNPSEPPKNNAMSEVHTNLDLMGQSLSRLKSLGLGMQTELDEQDPIIERLNTKVNRVDAKIHVTNKEMMKINNR